MRERLLAEAAGEQEKGLAQARVHEAEAEPPCRSAGAAGGREPRRARGEASAEAEAVAIQEKLSPRPRASPRRPRR